MTHEVYGATATASMGAARRDAVGQDEPVPSPTVVLLHGQPDSSASFWALRAELRRRLDPSIRIAAPDRPGYGVNRLPATDYPGNVRWLNDWLTRFDAGPVVVVGHSWAGGVGILAASDPPVSGSTTWAGLVLLASIGPASLLPIDTVLAAPVLGETLSFLTFRLARAAIARRSAALLVRATPEAELPYARASGAAMRLRPFWRSFLLEQRALVAQLPLITDALPRLSLPVSVISGRRDTVVPVQTGVALHRLVPGSTRHELDGGHDLPVRQPAAVAGLIADLAVEAFARTPPVRS